MKKGILGGTILLSFTMMGCTQSLSSEEVVSEAKANQEDVENYHATIDLGISVRDQESGEPLQETFTHMDVDINETTMDTYGTLSVDDTMYSATQEYYDCWRRSLFESE